MGLFTVGCRIENHHDSTKSVVIPRLLVDTGSEFTWVPTALLEKAGIEPRKRDIQIQMANGQVITRSVGYAVIKVNKAETVDEIVFAQKGDLLLGCRALDGLNVRVDSRAKKLVAATAIHPRA